MNYTNNNMNNNSKAWAPQPMKHTGPSNRVNNGKKQFARSMAQATNNTNNFSVPYMVTNLKRTENGALQYSTTGKALLDINYQLASLRNKDESTIISMYRKAFTENPTFAIRWLFYATDIRKGAGERRIFQVIVKDMIQNGGANIVVNMVPLIPEYSRWDMLYTLLEVTNGKVYSAVKNLIISQWNEDIVNMRNGKPISLMAKWLKSANSHNAETRQKGLMTANMLGLTERQYRKNLSEMRDYLKVVETRMSSDNWQAIDYEQVPSKANLIYNKAFMRHDGDRRTAYLNALNSGKAKINSSVAYPYEILNKLINCGPCERGTFENMWKSLPNLLANDYSDTLVVCDTSGSMDWMAIPNTQVTPMIVAFAISIYMAERNRGPFCDMVMSFSNKPKLIDLPDNATLYQKYRILTNNAECSNTNIEATFNLILNTAIKNNYSQSDLPSRLLIITDGEFDSMTYSGVSCRPNQTMFKAIENRFKEHGYIMPKLVFWNVANRSGTMPFNENESFPCTLVSGFSINTFKMVMSDKTSPWDALVEQLLDTRYDAAENCLFTKKNLTKTNRDNISGGVTIRGRVNSNIESSSYRKPSRKGPNKTKGKHVAKSYRTTSKNMFNNSHKGR